MNRARALALLLCLCFAARPALADDKPVFQEQFITLAGNADFVTAADFNGDGFDDLAVMLQDRIHFYYQKDGKYPAAASETIFPGKTTVMVDFEDMNRDGAVDIVVMSSIGCYYLKNENGKFNVKFNPLARFVPDLRPTTQGRFPWLDFAGDFNGDGFPDFWGLENGMLMFYYGSEGAMVKGGPIELDSDTEWLLQTQPSPLQSSIHYNFQYGGLFFRDFNRDGRPDLAYLLRNKVVVYPQSENGRFDGNRRDIFRMPDGAKVESLEKFLATEPLFEDVNGDGFIDLVRTWSQEGVVKVYYGSDDNDCYQNAAQVIKEKGWIYETHLIDLNGDGRKDLFTLQTGNVSWSDALKIFLSRETEVYAEVYFNRKAADGAPFSDKHDYIEKFTNPMTFKVGYTGILEAYTRIFINASTDFNNDGKCDLFAMTDDLQVSLYRGGGGKREFYAGKPDWNYTVPTAESYNSVLETLRDLNGDGRKDFVLHYRAPEGKDDQIVVFQSLP